MASEKLGPRSIVNQILGHRHCALNANLPGCFGPFVVCGMGIRDGLESFYRGDALYPL
jgi:hypothetical protein